MKFIQLLKYALIGLPVLFAACSDSEAPTPIQPDPKPVEKTEVNFVGTAPTFEEKAQQQEVEIKATGSWTAETDQEWCTVSPTSGASGSHTLTISVTENDAPEERNASVVVKTKDMEKRMTVSQKQYDALFLTSGKAEISGKKQTVEVTIKANISYSYRIDEKAENWIKATKSRGLEAKTHQFEVTDNNSTKARQGKIFFEGGDLKETFTIYQQPGEEPQLVLSEKDFVTDHQQNEIKIELKSNSDYQMILPKTDWIHEKESRSLSSYTRYLIIDAYDGLEDRTADILFAYGDKVEKVSITQKAKDAIILAKNQYEIDLEGGDLYFTVASNTTYTTECKADWIKQVTASRSIEVKELHFVLDRNMKEEARTGEIIFKSKNTEQKVKIIQTGKTSNGLVILTQPTTFKSEGGKQQIVIAADQDWSVESLVNWCKVSPTNGHAGHESLTIEVEANTTYDERNAGIVFTYGTKSQTITVVQKQKNALILGSAKAELPQKGGSVTFEVKSNIDYTVEIDDEASSWITQTGTRALRTEVLQFNVAPNDSYKRRVANITLKGNGLMERYQIFQEGKEGATFILSKTEYQFDKKSHQFTVELKTNANYKIVIPTDSWIHKDESRAISSYTHHFTIDENNEGRPRKTNIQFHLEDRIETVTIYQAATEVSTKCDIGIFTYAKSIQMPLLTGGETMKATMQWNDEGLIPYDPNQICTFEGKNYRNSVHLETENVDVIHFKNVEGVVEIDCWE